MTGQGQLGAPIAWVEVPGADGLFHAVQSTRDGRLFLTANESFFPKLGLAAEGSGAVPDIDDLNGGKSFATIGKWNAGDAAEWGLWLPRTGTLTLAVHLAGDGGRFRVRVGEQSLVVSPTSRPGAAATGSFSIKAPGRHSLVLTCESAGNASAFRWIELGGAAAAESGVLRKRWRPAAAHTKFWSSRSTDRVRLWVMEMDAVPGDLGFYSPVTTPFGYYGPTWQPDGTVGSGFNFSLWSFGRGEPEPPIERLSHLLAIGHPEATFGGFDHEGTGVKIRDWEPLKGRQAQRQALALRVEPGKLHDTYYSYFYAADEGRWRFFGAGKKFNGGRPLDQLWVGSFVEVPGPPPVQRTGPWERRMRYRGWVMDEKGGWHPLDRMERGNVDKATGLTHTDRGVTDDGWFYLQTGGWFFRKVRSAEPVVLDRRGGPSVDYLGPEDLAFLVTVPCEVAVTGIERSGERARVSLSVRNAGKKGTVSLFWGPDEGLTFEERWQHRSASGADAKEGTQHVLIDGVEAGRPLFVRALLRNEEGQFWSAETQVSEGR